jgi:hypothetical protein
MSGQMLSCTNNNIIEPKKATSTFEMAFTISLKKTFKPS